MSRVQTFPAHSNSDYQIELRSSQFLHNPLYRQHLIPSPSNRSPSTNGDSTFYLHYLSSADHSPIHQPVEIQPPRIQSNKKNDDPPILNQNYDDDAFLQSDEFLTSPDLSSEKKIALNILWILVLFENGFYLSSIVYCGKIIGIVGASITIGALAGNLIPLFPLFPALFLVKRQTYGHQVQAIKVIIIGTIISFAFCIATVAQFQLLACTTPDYTGKSINFVGNSDYSTDANSCAVKTDYPWTRCNCVNQQSFCVYVDFTSQCNALFSTLPSYLKYFLIFNIILVILVACHALAIFKYFQEVDFPLPAATGREEIPILMDRIYRESRALTTSNDVTADPHLTLSPMSDLSDSPGMRFSPGITATREVTVMELNRTVSNFTLQDMSSV